MFTTWHWFEPNGDGEPMRYGPLPFDTDDAKEPGRALDDMRNLCLIQLPEIFGVDPYSIEYYMSGGKGLHATLDPIIVGSEAGSRYLPLVYKAMVKQWVESLRLRTLDLTIYAMESGKMFRIANVRRSNGRYKVPITLEEFRDLTINELTELTKAPRTIDPVEYEEAPAEGLQRLYLDCKAKVEAEQEKLPAVKAMPAADFSKLNGKLTPCIKAVLSDPPPKSDTVNFNRLVMLIITFCQQAGIDLQTAAGLAGPKLIRAYTGSDSYPTPEARAKHFTDQWDYLQKSTKYRFDCSFAHGLHLPGTAYECRGCPLDDSDARIGGLIDAGSHKGNPDDLLKELKDTLDRNEEGDALLIKRRYVDKIVYDHVENAWYGFMGHHWQRDDTDRIRRVIVKTADLYIEGAGLCLDKIKELDHQLPTTMDEEAGETAKAVKKKQDALMGLHDKFIKRNQMLRGDARAKRALVWAASGEPLAVSSDVWEPDPYLLGVKNGIVDLRTGDLRHGRPQDYIRTAIPYAFDPNATCQKWERFLMDIFAQPNQNDTLALVDYFQDLIGYTLIGIAREAVFVILYGSGRNGKTTLLEVLAAILGPYALKASSELFLKNFASRGLGAADADTLALRHKRLVYCSETDEGRKLDANRVKHLTGGDKLQARGLYEKHPTEFVPSHTPYLITNDKPQIRSDDDAIWYRIKSVPMLTAFIDDPQGPYQRPVVKDMKEQLLEEAGGILTWAVRGAEAYLTGDLTTPAIIANDSKEYRRGESLLRAWVDECCVIMPGIREQAKELFTSFNIFLEENGYRKWVNKTFINKLEKEVGAYGVKKDKNKNGAFFEGIGLRQINDG